MLALCFPEQRSEEEGACAPANLGEHAMRRAVCAAALAIDEADVDHWEEARTLVTASLRVEANKKLVVAQRAVKEKIRVDAEGDVSVERHGITAEADGPAEVMPSLPPQMVHVPLADLPLVERVSDRAVAAFAPHVCAVSTADLVAVSWPRNTDSAPMTYRIRNRLPQFPRLSI
mgnify:CR=1 FL=1